MDDDSDWTFLDHLDDLDDLDHLFDLRAGSRPADEQPSTPAAQPVDKPKKQKLRRVKNKRRLVKTAEEQEEEERVRREYLRQRDEDKKRQREARAQREAHSKHIKDRITATTSDTTSSSGGGGSDTRVDTTMGQCDLENARDAKRDELLCAIEEIRFRLLNDKQIVTRAAHHDIGLVFCQGDPTSEVFVIGDAPGIEREQHDTSIFGPSGKILDQVLRTESIQKQLTGSSVFSTNCVFTRPRGGREPNSSELALCAPYLRELILLCKPRLIVCMGQIAATLIRCGVSVERMYGYSTLWLKAHVTPVGAVNVYAQEGQMAHVAIGPDFVCRSVVLRHPTALLREIERAREKNIKLWATHLFHALDVVHSTEPEPLHRLRKQPRVQLQGERSTAHSGSVSNTTSSSTSATTATADGTLRVPLFHSRREFEEYLHSDNEMYKLGRWSADEIAERYLGHSKLTVLLRDTIYNADRNHFSLYCTTSHSHNVRVLVKNFMFPFFVSPHAAFWGLDGETLDRSITPIDTELLQNTLLRMIARYSVEDWERSFQTPYHHVSDSRQFSIQVLASFDMRILNDGYQPSGTQMLCIQVSHYLLIRDVINLLRRLISNHLESKYARQTPTYEAPSRSNRGPYRARHRRSAADFKREYKTRMRVCNANFSPEYSFVYTSGVRMSHWLRLESFRVLHPPPFDGPHGSIRRLGHALVVSVPAGEVQHKLYTVELSVENIDCLDSEETVEFEDGSGLTSSDHAPSVHCALDIECSNSENRFPDAFYDPVVCVSTTVQHKNAQTHYDTNNGYVPQSGYHEVSFCLGTCDGSNLGARQRIYCFKSERLMLECLFEWLRRVDPDRLIGHNVKRFDFSYLVRRAEMLEVPEQQLGRDPEKILRVDYRKFASRAFGERVITSLRGMDGWIVIDTLDVYLREKKETSYRLDALAQKYIGCKKDDVPYSAIHGLFTGSPQDRRRLIDYCVRDARLCDQLVNKHAWDVQMTEFARVNGAVGENDLYVAGQQAKVFSAVAHRNRLLGGKMLLDTPPSWQKRSLILHREQQHREASMSAEIEFASLNDSPFLEHESKVGADGCPVISKDATSNEIQSIMNELRGGSASTLDIQARLEYFATSTTTAEAAAAEEGHDSTASGMTVDDVALASEYLKAKKQRERKRKHGVFWSTEDSDNVPDDPLASLSGVADGLSGDASQQHTQRYHSMSQALGNVDDDSDTQQQQSVIAPTTPTHDQQRLRQQMATYRSRLQKEVAELNNTSAVSAAVAGAAAYQGAEVMPAVPGLHTDLPVCCVDFASLYPSIMLRYNISLDTKCYESDLERFGLDAERDCHRMPITGYNERTNQQEQLYFVRQEVLPGLLPVTEKDLLAARKRARNLAASYALTYQDKETGEFVYNPRTDPVKYTNLDGRQAQIKIVCNSLYGAMGASGQLSDKDCAAAVTAIGRDSIMLVRRILERRYNAFCVGGDTDSVFMNFPGFPQGHQLEADQRQKRIEDVPAMEEFSVELTDFINEYFEEPMRITYEKAMYPLLVLAKKRYCGVIHVMGEKPHFFAKGAETVRRDSTPYTRETLHRVFDLVLLEREPIETAAQFSARIERGIDQAVELVRERSKALLEGRVPVSKLVLSKQYSREVYTNPNAPHLEVMRKMVARNEEPPALGERIPFVYVLTPKDSATGREPCGYQMAEHPDHAIKSNMQLNYAYYLEHCFKEPIVRVFKHVLRRRIITSIVRDRQSCRMDQFVSIGAAANRSTGFTVESSSAAPTPSTTNTLAENIGVSATQIADATARLVFLEAPKRSVARRDVQTKFASLSRRYVQPKLIPGKSPLARFLTTSRNNSASAVGHTKSSSSSSSSSNNNRSAEKASILTKKNLCLIHHTDGDVDKARHLERETVKEATRCFRERLATCQRCVRQTVVICSARECDDYYPRIEAEGVLLRARERATALEVDIEDLVL